MCLLEDSETDSESSTEDLSLLQTKQQRQQRQQQLRQLRKIVKSRERLGGVSDDDVRGQSVNVEHQGTSEVPPSHRGIDVVSGLGFVGPQSEVCANNSSDPTVVEPQLHVVSETQASSFGRVPGPAADHEEVETQARAFPGPNVVIGDTGRSGGQAGASVVVVHASVERDPLTSADHS